MAYNFSPIDKKLTEVTEWLKKEYSQLSTGRANPALLDSVRVESYGTLSPIQNVASVTIEEARTMRLVPWDKSQMKAIEKAILESKIPVSVSTDDQGLRVTVPQMTEDSKKIIVKLAKEKLEQARVSVRGIRTEGMDDIKETEKAEDDRKRSEEELQKRIDAANASLEEIFEKKDRDIMSV